MEDIFTFNSGEDLTRLLQFLQLLADNLYENDLLDNADMKRIFNVCDKTLYRWRKKKSLIYIRIGGKFYYSKRILYNTIYQTMLMECPKHLLPKLL